MLNNIFKNCFTFLKCTDWRDFFFKNCTDCKDFFLKMYGFLYGFFQKSFGHPVDGLLKTMLCRWSTKECERRGVEVSPEKKRFVLGEALFLIR